MVSKSIFNMNKYQKLLLLKKLYLYRSLGIEFFEEEFNETSSDNSNLNSIEALKKIVLDCNLCSLSKTRKNVVFGEGNPNAKLLFVGEGPGAIEDETGRPFVGRAGELLTKIINVVLELERKDVFIANIVKCRPPNNRVPTEEEANLCIPYLFKQIDLIKPKIIVTLGATAYKFLTGNHNISISKIRGEVFKFNNKILIPTFHPSYLLRKPSAKREAYKDFLKIKEFYYGGEI